MIKVILLYAALIACAVMLTFFAGCATSKIISPDPNGFIFEGPAADVMSQAMALNITDEGGRLTSIVGEMTKYVGWLLLSFVGGLVFWGYTKSKWGWIIPASSVAGIILVVTISKIAVWIPYIVVGIALVVLIYKATEYQRERNENLK